MRVETSPIPIDFSRTYSAEEFERLEDDGEHYELIEGKLVMTPPPNFEHGDISDELISRLRSYLKANPGTGKAWSHIGFNIGKKPNGKDNVPEPDLGFIRASRLPATGGGYLPYPDLVVEVWSPGSDLGDSNKLKKAREKLQLYLQAGTTIAWGINPEKREVEVYYRDPSRVTKVLKAGDELDGEEIIPGFKVFVRELFEVL